MNEKDELDAFIQQHIDQYHQEALPDFEGLSPDQMHHLLYFTFGKESIVTLQKLSVEQYLQVPLLQLCKYFLELLSSHKQIKLTAKEYLPVKIVEELYAQGYIKEELVELGIIKRKLEKEILSIELCRILMQIMKLVKIRHNKLSITEKGKKILQEHDHVFLTSLFISFVQEFNWGYFDGYDIDEWGQMGAGFSFYLLHKYGRKQRESSFYAEKYITAFPALIDNIEVIHPAPYTNVKRSAYNAYTLRTFERFLLFFGMVEYERKKGFGLEDHAKVKTTDLFHDFISIKK